MVQLSNIHILVAACLVSLGSCVVITGVQGGVNQETGQRPSRPCFTDFTNSGPAFDLYILSLQQFHLQNQSAQLSFYQIAGIHGHPYISWDGVYGKYQAGYCTHGSILFPMWHRPYLALFEQILWGNAQGIAASYPASQRIRYQAAAVTFRIPYWDWAYNATMPDEVNQHHISVNTPQGRMHIANPLYNYTFHPQPSASDFPPLDALSKYHSTVRYPDATGNSQPTKSNAQLQANAQALHDLTYQLIAEQSNYAPFSNTGVSGGLVASYNSIENLHNAIHSLVGQTGHMAIIPFSSFDPIFWLHHANVDRLISIWQAIYPNSFTTPQVDFYGTYTNAPGETEDVDTPLTPFHSDDSGTFYNSATARYIRTFGYTYPEITDWGVNATQLSSNVRRNLNLLYNPSGSISSRSLGPRHRLVHRPRDVQTHIPYKNANDDWVKPIPPPRRFASRSGNIFSLNSSIATNESESYQYFVNIRVDKSALSQSFFIHFFIGTIPVSPALWSTAATLIASQSILFTPSSLSSNSNNTVTTRGQIPLNHVLTTLPSLSPSSVIPLLQKQLQWRIQTFDENPVNISRPELASLKIFVVGREVSREAQEDRFAEYGTLRIWREATRGKGGALGGGEGM